MNRTLPPTFRCKGCDVSVERRPTRDIRTDYCSRACKLRVFRARARERKMRTCATCAQPFVGYAALYCSAACRPKPKYTPRPNRRPKNLLNLTCAQCGVSFQRYKSSASRTCSRACQHIYQVGRAIAIGTRKSHRRVCSRCSSPFTSNHSKCRVCKSCTARRLRRIARGVRRARKRSVQYENIDPIRAFERDGWRCQLCGCSTPQRLRGHMVDRAPELDHIIPLASGGSHTWANVQCACRKCNGFKGANTQGQLRLEV